MLGFYRAVAKPRAYLLRRSDWLRGKNMLPMVANSVAICKNRADARGQKRVAMVFFHTHQVVYAAGLRGYRVVRSPGRLVLTIQQ